MKIDSKPIIKRYLSNRQSYEDLAYYVYRLLYEKIEKNGLKIHSIASRIKEVDSIMDKMRRNSIVDPFVEMHDLVGFRVVCLFLADIDTIGDIVDREFDVFEKDNKIYEKELDAFGYMSLHLKAKLRQSFEEPAKQHLREIPFEIQVRTIAQDAWASISHHLNYKKKSGVPTELKRDFNALSGLFYVADTHFLMIRQQILQQSVETSSKTDGELVSPTLG